MDLKALDPQSLDSQRDRKRNLLPKCHSLRCDHDVCLSKSIACKDSIAEADSGMVPFNHVARWKGMRWGIAGSIFPECIE